MVTASEYHPISPFMIDPRPDEKKWLLVFLLFIAAGVIGWQCDFLTTALLIAMSVYGLVCWWQGRATNVSIAAAARMAGEDWQRLRGISLDQVGGIVQRGNGGLLLRAANALHQCVERNGKVDVDAIVTAVLAGLASRVHRMETAAANAPRMGLAGTAFGLWLLYAGIKVTSDPQALSDSVLEALGGMKFAVATTLAGILIEKLLSNQRSPAETALSELHAQMVAQLNLLHFGRTNNG